MNEQIAVYAASMFFIGLIPSFLVSLWKGPLAGVIVGMACVALALLLWKP